MTSFKDILVVPSKQSMSAGSVHFEIRDPELPKHGFDAQSSVI